MGTSKEDIINSVIGKDHPHAYGDKQELVPEPLREQGSSPRVWGQVQWRQFARRLSRIIPTRMGTSPKSKIISPTVQDHPHAYGDKNNTGFGGSQQRGSSPRVWGQAFIFSGQAPFARIIPTRMGTRITVITHIYTQ